MAHFKTVSQIKAAAKGCFFDRKTMRFFGDTMRSFGIRHLDGKTYIYRKPVAYVNAPFSGRVKAEKNFFGCWEVVCNSDGVDISAVSQETKERIYTLVTR